MGAGRHRRSALPSGRPFPVNSIAERIPPRGLSHSWLVACLVEHDPDLSDGAAVKINRARHSVGFDRISRQTRHGANASRPQVSDRSMSMIEVSRYHPLLVALHWLLAVLIVAALALGALVMAKLPNSDPAKLEALRSHMAGGALILGLTLTRLIVRVRTMHPARASTGSLFLNMVAWASHRMLYVLIFTMAASGITMALQAGLVDVVYGGHGALPPDLWVYPVRSLHYLISRMLMALIALHIAGALYHAVILRDGLLRRMAFGRRLRAARNLAFPALNRPISKA